MRKRLCALLLAAVLCVLLLPAPAQAANIYFVAVDDSIPLTMPDSASPYFAGGSLFAPYTVFNASPGGVVPSYNAAEQTLVLFRRGARLVFDLSNGTVTDEDKNVYERTTVYRNGVLYIPLDFCLEHFGLSVTTLNSASGYPILRFTTGNEVYDDALFIERAENLISYLAEQYQNQVPEDFPRPTGGTPDEEPDEPRSAGTFYLAVTGLENMGSAAQALLDAGQRAAFFLTAEEIRSAPALVRALYTAGHAIGITCAADADDAAIALKEANDALEQTLHRKTLLALLTPAQSEFCPGYCIFVSQPQTAPLPELVAQSEETQSSLVLCGADVADVLQTLKSGGASIRVLRETSPLALILTPPEEEEPAE